MNDTPAAWYTRDSVHPWVLRYKHRVYAKDCQDGLEHGFDASIHADRFNHQPRADAKHKSTCVSGRES